MASKESCFVCNGATNHSKSGREENDYYATEPKAAEILLEVETFKQTIWECACGQGHLAKVFLKKGYRVIATDLIDRGYGKGNVDFLKCKEMPCDADIITNPPYSIAIEFVEHALDILPVGGKVAMFLKLTFLEGKKRKKLFMNHPPRTIYVSSSRVQCAKNGDFSKYKNGVGTAVAYAWYVFEKGYYGETIVKWIN